MFEPKADILQKYADLMIRFAVNGGRGPKKGDVVQLSVPDIAKPLFLELLRAVLEVGAHPKIHFIPTLADKVFFTHADNNQLIFFPEKFKKSEAELIDHQVSIIADANPRELSAIDPSRIFKAMDSRKKMRDWLNAKEENKSFTWTLALYGTEPMAKEAGLTIREYWDQIEKACFLDCSDPVSEWRKIHREQERLKKVLNALEIEWVHVEAEKIDLHVQLGKNRQWLGGSCRNIPSFEIFISPDWRGTHGNIYFNQPLFRYGNILKDIRLDFSQGVIRQAKARKGQKVLDSMIQRKNADKIGEFSLTDRRFSRITKFMANTLFDENIGGRYGNTHIAIGRAYKDSYVGDMSKPSKKDWQDWGFNESPEHTDIISTEDRIVTATLPNGSTKVIFKDGQFTV